MPYDSNGIFSIDPGYLAILGQTIQPSQHNPPLEDIVAAGLSNVLVRDGRAPMTGNLRMGNFKISSLANATLAGDAVNKSQLDATTGDIAAKYVVKTANYTAVDTDTNTTLRFTSAATLAFDVTANLRTNWRVEVWNDSSGLVTIDPDSADTINGAATLVLQPRQRAEIFKTGATTFQASIFGDQLSGPQLQGTIVGLTMSNNASDANNDIDIAVGSAASDASPYYLMSLGSILTKRLDAAWAVGNNSGGLATGSKANSTWYHVFLIQRSDTGVVDVMFDTSVTGANAPANYDRKRRIGSVRTDGSGNILAFFQDGDLFLWSTVKADVNTSVTTSAILCTITVPLGLRVRAWLQCNTVGTSEHLYVSSPQVTSEASNISVNTNLSYPGSGGSRIPVELEVLTNTSSQVRAIASGSTTLNVNTKGYFDSRGSDA